MMTPHELARSNYVFWTMLPLILFEYIDIILVRAQGAWAAQQVSIANGWETLKDELFTQTPMLIPNTNDLAYLCLSNETGHTLKSIQIRNTKSAFGDIITTAVSNIGFNRELDGHLNEVCVVAIPEIDTKLILEILEYEADLPDGPCISTLFPMKTVPSGTTLGRRVYLSLESTD